jgi:hypothetical protein
VTLNFLGADRIDCLAIGGRLYTDPGTYGHSSANPTVARDDAFAPAPGTYLIPAKGGLLLIQ